MATPSSRQVQLASKVREAVEAGEKFIDIFYETVDKRRQVDNMSEMCFISIWNPPKEVSNVLMKFRSCLACIPTHLWSFGTVTRSLVPQIS